MDLRVHYLLSDKAILESVKKTNKKLNKEQNIVLNNVEIDLKKFNYFVADDGYIDLHVWYDKDSYAHLINLENKSYSSEKTLSKLLGINKILKRIDTLEKKKSKSKLFYFDNLLTEKEVIDILTFKDKFRNVYYLEYISKKLPVYAVISVILFVIINLVFFY